MPVGEIVSERYGLGGMDTAKPNGNRVERQVITAETATDQTIEVHDGSGGVIRSYLRPRDLPAENGTIIRQQALVALAGNRTYVALASPTAAQTTSQVKALTRQMSGLIRLVLGVLDGTE